MVVGVGVENGGIKFGESKRNADLIWSNRSLSLSLASAVIIQNALETAEWPQLCSDSSPLERGVKLIVILKWDWFERKLRMKKRNRRRSDCEQVVVFGNSRQKWASNDDFWLIGSRAADRKRIIQALPAFWEQAFESGVEQQVVASRESKYLLSFVCRFPERWPCFSWEWTRHAQVWIWNWWIWIWGGTQISVAAHAHRWSAAR